MKPLHPELLVDLALDQHRRLLAEAQTERQLCCPPKKVRVALPARPAFPAVSADCLTC